MQHFQTSLKLILISVGLIYLVLMGFGSSIGSKPGLDFAVFYNAGHLLLDGVNPYLPQAPTRAVPVEFRDRLRRPYAYPPQFSSICIGLALLPYNAAWALLGVLNLTAIAALAWGATLFLWPGRRLATAIMKNDAQAPAGITDWRRHWWIIVAIIVGQPFTSYTLWLGQTTIYIFALLVWAWWFEMRGDWLRGGVLLGISTCNPPLVLLPIVWLLCDRRFKTLIVGLATALAMSIPALYVVGPLDAFHSWYDALSTYSVSRANVPGHKETFGLRSLLVAAGVPMGDLTMIGIAFAVVIWFFRSSLTDAETVALLVVGGLLTVPAHTPALIGLIITVPVLCRHMDQRRWVAPVALGLGALILVPRRILPRGLELSNALLHWRVPLVLGLALMIITLVVLREHDESTNCATTDSDS